MYAWVGIDSIDSTGIIQYTDYSKHAGILLNGNIRRIVSAWQPSCQLVLYMYCHIPLWTYVSPASISDLTFREKNCIPNCLGVILTDNDHFILINLQCGDVINHHILSQKKRKTLSAWKIGMSCQTRTTWPSGRAKHVSWLCWLHLSANSVV